MSDIINFPSGALAVPAADIRLFADMLISMQHACAQVAQTLIDRLDEFDGDPDLEDATDAEDDHAISALGVQYAERGPGCTISDPDSAVDDQACDPESDCGI